MRFGPLILLLLSGFATSITSADAQESEGAAFLFGYRAKPGMDEAFAAGYRSHLQWHAEHADSLTWLAWTVVMGDHIDAFVDGVFGVPMAAMDRRVDPRGDADDGALNITPFADPIFRYVLIARPDLSSADRTRSVGTGVMQRVVWFTLPASGSESFEEALRELAAAHSGDRGVEVFELVTGGRLPRFVLVVQLDGWADLGDETWDPVRSLIRSGAAAGAAIESEVWRFRPDLTYRP